MPYTPTSVNRSHQQLQKRYEFDSSIPTNSRDLNNQISGNVSPTF
jgi:hypothetical protein